VDCCSDRFTDYKIELLGADRNTEYEIGPIVYVANSEETFSYSDINAYGQFLRISMPGDDLHLAEVEVFSKQFFEEDAPI